MKQRPVFSGMDRTVVTGKDLRINLGAGREALEGWFNTDWYDLPGIDLVQNLLFMPYPFGDESAKVVRAWDVLEHMPSHLPDGRSFPIEFMNEIWRILKPGGQFLIHVPDARHAEWATDISHVRPYMPESFDHFDPDTELGKMFPFYSDRKWKIVEREAHNKNLSFKLEKR
jgi:predicted SAM-dependent methyltransferase